VPDEPADDEVVGNEQLAAITVHDPAQLRDRGIQAPAVQVAFFRGNPAEEVAVGFWHHRRDGGQVLEQPGFAHRYALQVVRHYRGGLGGPAQRAVPDDIERHAAKTLPQLVRLPLTKCGEPLVVGRLAVPDQVELGSGHSRKLARALLPY
jgi:hypothetical protein